jgi:hypothetical protein
MQQHSTVPTEQTEDQLSSISLPKKFEFSEIRSAELPSPLNHLATPQGILDTKFSKRKIHLLHSVVHAFRAAFHFDEQGGNSSLFGSPRYQQAVEHFEQMPRNIREKRAITQLSTPRAYAQMRRGDRMRKHLPTLEQSELQWRCREIRAALVWRQLKGITSPS